MPPPHPSPPSRRAVRADRLRWPLPAALAWAGAWAGWQAVLAAGAPPAAALIVALAVGGCCAWQSCSGARRRAIAAAGFPAALALLTAAPALPPLAWLALLVPLFAVYPLRAWRDAPFFPTPHDALDGIADLVVPPPRSVLDAGCGAGHGLAALRRAWPRARLSGVEWSAPLAWAAARRCRDARVVRGDMWASSWAGHDLVYVFQRPESMARAWAKACADMVPGAVLVSLEFPVPGVVPVARGAAAARPVWIYQVPGPPRSTGAGPGR